MLAAGLRYRVEPVMIAAMVRFEGDVQQQDTTYPHQVSLLGISSRALGIEYLPSLLLALTIHPSGNECCGNSMVLWECDKKLRGIEENGSPIRTKF